MFFDGKKRLPLIENQSVLIEGNIIKQVGENIEAPKGAKIIDAKRSNIKPRFY